MNHREHDKDISFKDAYIYITSFVKLIICLFLDNPEQTTAIHRECNKNLSLKDTGKNFVTGFENNKENPLRFTVNAINVDPLRIPISACFWII